MIDARLANRRDSSDTGAFLRSTMNQDYDADMKFKEGQWVQIKNPRPVVATVLRERPGDRDLPEDERHIMVHIEGGDYIYRPDDLVPLDEPKLTPFSSEWTKEFQRFVESGNKLIADPDDHASRDQFVDAGEKIGWIVPIKEKA
jgi:hypothetical protein